VTRHLAIIGPTATGKSALALALAESLGETELISLDSMQVYREMDIGTAKPSVADRAAVPHHLIDVADPSAEWSVRATQHAARVALAGIEARGRRAIFVGGTGLYVRAVVDALDVPATDDALRARLTAETATDTGLAAAFARLQSTDPAAAARIEPGNQRRIVRALEVIELTGRPFSSFGAGLTEYGPPALDVTMIGLDLPSDHLRARIAERFSAMRAAGLINEVSALAARPGGLSRTASQAIGYKELLTALASGDSLEASLETAVFRTRQFARRQRVWFRRDPRIRWLEAGENHDRNVASVLALWRADLPSEASA
jgi:tRNA dimethylallyltransferase